LPLKRYKKTMQSINLIPKGERIEQREIKLVKISTVVAIIIFLMVNIVSGYYYYTTSNLKKEISKTDMEIQNLRGEVGKLSDIEISSRNLYKKTFALKEILNERKYYSALLENLQSTIPENVLIDDFSMGNEDTLDITGVGSDYPSIQVFTNNVLANKLFTEVSLNSVTLNSKENNISFFIVITYDVSKLND